MKLTDVIDQQYCEFIRGERVLFPRDLAFPWRRKVRTLEEYISTIHRMREQSNVYVALYSDISIDHDRYHRILVDFDTNSLRPTLNDVWKDVRKFGARLREKYDAEPQFIFTGGGFHCIIEIPEITLNFPKAMQHLVVDIATEVGVGAIDGSVLGDKRRITRLPFTLNLKEKYDPKPLCIPVRLDWSLAKVIHEAHYCSYEVLLERKECEAIVDDLLEYERALFHEYECRRKFKPKLEAPTKRAEKLKKELKALERLAELIARKLDEIPESERERVFDGRHRLLHYRAIPILVALGASNEEIEGWARDWIQKTGNAWDEKRRRAVVQSIERTRAGPKGDYSEPWSPWSWERFYAKYPELLTFIERKHLGGMIE